jgi:hypothetical protein
MKKYLPILFFMIIIFGIFAQALAQREMRFRGSDGWGGNTPSRYESLFDINNVRIFNAAVVRVDTASPPRELKMGVGMRLFVTIEGTGEEIPVHLGPMWFAINQDGSFPKGESLQIRGYRASYPGVANSDFIMPVEMRRKDRIFRFRDDDGNPFWNIHRNR